MIFEVRVTANARRDRDRVILWLDEHYPHQVDRFIDDYEQTLRRIEQQALLPAADDTGRWGDHNA
jgi:hypothetical protein